VRAVEHGATIPRVDEQGFGDAFSERDFVSRLGDSPGFFGDGTGAIAQTANGSCFLALGQEPETDGNLSRVKQLAR